MSSYNYSINFDVKDLAKDFNFNFSNSCENLIKLTFNLENKYGLLSSKKKLNKN